MSNQHRLACRLCRANLEELDVSWCRGIPEEALGRLVDACPALTSLTLFGCSQARPASPIPCSPVPVLLHCEPLPGIGPMLVPGLPNQPPLFNCCQACLHALPLLTHKY